MTTVQVPPANVPFFAADGSISQPWRKLFDGLAERVGGYDGGSQPSSPVLDGISSLNSTPGLLAQLDADSFTKRTLTAGAGLTVTNGTGASGNPTVALTAITGVSGVHASPTSITIDGYGRVTAISP